VIVGSITRPTRRSERRVSRSGRSLRRGVYGPTWSEIRHDAPKGGELVWDLAHLGVTSCKDRSDKKSQLRQKARRLRGAHRTSTPISATSPRRMREEESATSRGRTIRSRERARWATAGRQGAHASRRDSEMERQGAHRGGWLHTNAISTIGTDLDLILPQPHRICASCGCDRPFDEPARKRASKEGGRYGPADDALPLRQSAQLRASGEARSASVIPATMRRWLRARDGESCACWSSTTDAADRWRWSAVEELSVPSTRNADWCRKRGRPSGRAHGGSYSGQGFVLRSVHLGPTPAERHYVDSPPAPSGRVFEIHAEDGHVGRGMISREMGGEIGPEKREATPGHTRRKKDRRARQRRLESQDLRGPLCSGARKVGRVRVFNS